MTDLTAVVLARIIERVLLVAHRCQGGGQTVSREAPMDRSVDPASPSV